MSFGSPFMFLLLLVVPLVVGLYVLAGRQRMRYAVRYTNVDVLASVAPGRAWWRLLPSIVFLLALATLCVAAARPRVHTLVPSDRATITLMRFRRMRTATVDVLFLRSREDKYISLKRARKR